MESAEFISNPKTEMLTVYTQLDSGFSVLSLCSLKLPEFYNDSGRDFICSQPEDEGMTKCSQLPHFVLNNVQCNDSAETFSNNSLTNQSCIDWNQYYTKCKTSDHNPFQGAISFDNIGLAWVAIFQVRNFYFYCHLEIQCLLVVYVV